MSMAFVEDSVIAFSCFLLTIGKGPHKDSSRGLLVKTKVVVRPQW